MSSAGRLLYADETKSRGFVMVAASIPPASVASVRRDLRRLLMPGQTSVHFRSESNARRKQFLDLLIEQGWQAHVLSASSADQRDARRACLDRLVGIAADLGSSQLVLEADDSLMAHDRRHLFQAARNHPVVNGFTYRHLRRSQEPCLWAPDAVAWCWARGGEWRRRTTALLTGVIQVP